MSWWMEEVEPYEVVNYLTEFFDYDHGAGRLVWTRNKDMFYRLPGAVKRRAKMGAVAGTTTRQGYDYEIKIDNSLRRALPLLWEHQTGTCKRVMTIKPGETRFSIDNICLLPYGSQRSNKYRAKGLTVVSFSYERRLFTVVAVDNDYNKTVLSYHDNIDDAIDASKNPKVSFL
ncbi:hypothetical protein PODOV073v1_p0034 [Vibrio phage PS25B.1]|nr:hypothetical protein PODOV073v1_p0034 [Vibrio phage PS25B.1]